MTREEAVKAIKSHCYFANLVPVGKEALDMAIEALEKERKPGHWITKDGRGQGYDIAGIKTWYIQILCSECGFIKTAIEGHTGQYKYCPKCGAEMGGG